MKPSSEMDLTELLAELNKLNINRYQEVLDRLSRLRLDPARRVEVAKVLESVLDVEDNGIRITCLRALVVWGIKENGPAVIRCLRDPNARVDAMKVLGIIAYEPAAVPLAQQLFFDRGTASEALKKIGSKAEKAVIPSLQNPDWGVRAEACKILAEIGTKESKAVLLGACEDTSAFVVMEAKRAITLLAQRLGEQPPNLEPKPIPDMNLTELLAELKKPKTYRHQEILNRLGQMKVDPAHRVEVVKILESLLVGDDAMLRGACLKALGVWGNKDNVPALLKFLKDPSPFVRGPTITALVTIGDDRAVVPLIERLEDSFDRNAASQAIQKMGSSKHEKTVWPYLEHKDVWVKLEAIKILGAIGTKESKAVLEAACKDTNGFIVTEAKKALAAVAGRP